MCIILPCLCAVVTYHIEYNSNQGHSKASSSRRKKEGNFIQLMSLEKKNLLLQFFVQF